MMRKNLIIMLVAFVLVHACQNKNNDTNAKVGSKENKITEQICYVKAIKKENNAVYADIDIIEVIKTSEIDTSIAQSKIIELPGGVSLVNKEEKSELFEILPDAKIIMQTFSFDKNGNFNFNQSIKLKDFINEFNKPEGALCKVSPYRISITNNRITSLYEIYIP